MLPKRKEMPMNLQRIQQLADYIDTMPHHIIRGETRLDGPTAEDIDHFNLSSWCSSDGTMRRRQGPMVPGKCHTVGCIAGVAVLLWGSELSEPLQHMSIQTKAELVLGMERSGPSGGDDLFVPDEAASDHDIPIDEITPHQAARVLELVANGWDDRIAEAWDRVLGDDRDRWARRRAEAWGGAELTEL